MNTKKALATTLSIVTMMNSSIKADACDSAVVLEVAQEATVMCPVAAPVIAGTAVIVVTGITIYGKCCTNSTNEQLDIYYTLGHLPDYWKPGSVMDKINPNGRIIQRRIYDSQGRPLKDIDMSHHGTPKYHPWTYEGKHIHVHDYKHDTKKPRRAGREITQEEYEKYIKNVDKINVNKRYRMRVENKDNNNYVQQNNK